MTNQFTDEQVEAAAKALEKLPLDLITRRESRAAARAALDAAAGPAAVVQQVSESDAHSLVDEVIAIHADRIGTHYGDCYKYHVACLAVAVKHSLGGEIR